MFSRVFNTLLLSSDRREKRPGQRKFCVTTYELLKRDTVKGKVTAY